jgi:hypothetical protein
MRTSEMAWRTAAQLAALAQEADDDEEREYYLRMRNAWITLANGCKFLDVSNVSENSCRSAPRDRVASGDLAVLCSTTRT